MRALRFESGRLQVTDIPRPERPDEALVRVSLAGICSTDLHITRGYAGHVGTLGHEFVGIVESSPLPEQTGQRVVGEINAGCGACSLCLIGDSRHCEQRTVLGIHNRDGVFADYLTLPARNLLTVPDKVTDHQAVFTEPLAAACEILDQVSIAGSDRVAIIGDGKLGLLITRVLVSTGCRVVLIGGHEKKLQLARGSFVTTVMRDGVESLDERRFDFVVEASGSESGLDLAMKLVRPRGTIVLKSTFHGKVSLEAWRVVVDEVTIVGSRCGRFAPALELLKAGGVQVEDLIDNVFELSDGVAAMAAAARPGALKILIQP